MSNIIQTVFVILLIALGWFQIRASRRYFRQLKLHGNAEMSVFAPLALWSALVFGAFLIVGGIVLTLGIYH